jgi:peptide chain release factor 1
MPISVRARDRTVVASRWAKVVAGAGSVVGRHVDRLHRRDGALFRRRDALLQFAEVGGQGRLVTHGRGHAPEQGRHLRVRLREAEDVVDEQQNVLSFLVAEVLGAGHRGQADAGACSRRLVHLPVDESRFRDDARFAHLQPQVVAFAGALSDSAEHRVAAVVRGDVVDQLHDEHGFADAGAAEEADLSATRVRGQ